MNANLFHIWSRASIYECQHASKLCIHSASKSLPFSLSLSSSSSRLASKASISLIATIPHICHFFHTGRIFESQYFIPKNYEKHPKIRTNSHQKCKICIFSRSIWNFLHRTEFFYTGAACGACDKYEVCKTAQQYWVYSVFETNHTISHFSWKLSSRAF